MPPEGGSPGDPREWLRRARSNLARSSQGHVAPDVLLEDACFDAQQAVEKALNAVAARYPGPSEPVLIEDYEKAVAIAAAVVSWANGIVTAASEP